MKRKFGKLRSENKIKNYWYPKKRSLKTETRKIVQQEEVCYHEPNLPSEDENEYNVNHFTPNLLTISDTGVDTSVDFEWILRQIASTDNKNISYYN
jgi:hypothetical protein